MNNVKMEEGSVKNTGYTYYSSETRPHPFAHTHAGQREKCGPLASYRCRQNVVAKRTKN